MKNGNTNDSTFANFKRELQTLNYAELNYLISDIMLEIKKRSYNEGMVKAMTSYGSSAEAEAPTLTEKSPQQLRDEIVEKAKWDIVDLGGLYHFNYVVNREKRTVVALWKTKSRPANGKYKLLNRGIAKCDPTDCFNVHIGKAIALRRALGLEVPMEYLNAPQPTEVRVGDVVKSVHSNARGPVYGFTADNDVKIIDQFGDRYTTVNGKIIDDSREGGDANGEG